MPRNPKPLAPKLRTPVILVVILAAAGLGFWAALALLPPAVWFGLFFALGYIPGWGHDLAPLLWPTSLMLLLTAGRENTATSYLIVAASVLVCAWSPPITSLLQL